MGDGGVMSVILKGVNLPEEGKTLILKIKGSKIYQEYPKHKFQPTRIKDAEAIQIPKRHGRLKDFDADGVHPVIVDGEYMVRVDDLDEISTILEAEWLDE